MKVSQRMLFGMQLAFVFMLGTVAGAASVVIKTNQSTALTLNMKDNAGHVITRVYPDLLGWNYKVMNNTRQMSVMFDNPTVYRCGFEP